MGGQRVPAREFFSLGKKKSTSQEAEKVLSNTEGGKENPCRRSREKKTILFLDACPKKERETRQ